MISQFQGRTYRFVVMGMQKLVRNDTRCKKNECNLFGLIRTTKKTHCKEHREKTQSKC